MRSRPSLAHSILALILCAGLASGCRDSDREKAPSDRGSSFATSSAPAERSVVWRDDASRVGVDTVQRCGSPEKLTIIENVGSGCALFDADGDGRLDLLLASGGDVRDGRVLPDRSPVLWLQSVDGTFRDATEAVGLGHDDWGTGLAVGDFDNDGDADVFTAGWRADRLWENREGRFVDVSDRAGVDRDGFSTSAAWVDLDADGRLDLWVVRYVRFVPESLPNAGRPCVESGVETACGPTFYEPGRDLVYHNLGDGRFEEIGARLGLSEAPGGYGLGVAIGDLDADGRPDVYVANDTTANFLWRHRGELDLFEDALFAGAAMSEEGQGQAGMGTAIGDCDGDGHLDIWVSNYAREANAYYRNAGDGTFSNRSSAVRLGPDAWLSLGWSVALLDHDDDGDLDLAIANGHVHPQAHEVDDSLSWEQPCLFWENDGSGGFRPLDTALGSDATRARAHRASATGDIDDDGDVDLVLTVIDGPPVLLRNLRGRGRSVLIRLIGTRSNRDAIGARIEAEVGGRRVVREVSRVGGYLSSNDSRVHIGLGGAERIDRLTIRWPSGARETIGALVAGHEHTITEGRADQPRSRRLRAEVSPSER